jgi:hypothetical protein
MTLWAEGFLRHYPSVQIEIEAVALAPALRADRRPD